MNEARKRLIRAQAIAEAFERLDYLVTDKRNDATRYRDRIAEEIETARQNDEELDPNHWLLQEAQRLEAEAEIYEAVAKEILK